jgi:hypothetical protein
MFLDIHILFDFENLIDLIHCNVLQMAASFLGRANYLREKGMDAVDSYQPYFLFLIDKEESQIKGYEIRLKSCLNEVPCGEVLVLKDGILANMTPSVL